MNINEIMKKSLLLLTLAGFLTTQANATPTKTGETNAPKVTLEQQLAKYISYPDVLRATQNGGIVVIQVRVNARNEICFVEAFSQNEKINSSLISQLTGKRVVGYGSNTTQRHTVRLRFQPE